jgi:hypothetical protein
MLKTYITIPSYTSLPIEGNVVDFFSSISYLYDGNIRSE